MTMQILKCDPDKFFLLEQLLFELGYLFIPLYDDAHGVFVVLACLPGTIGLPILLVIARIGDWE